MQLSTELESCLREFSSAGPAELRENGARVAPLSTLSWEVRGNSEKPLLHLWSENHNLTRRVLAITDHSEQRLVLAVECFGRIKPDRLPEAGRRAFAEIGKPAELWKRIPADALIASAGCTSDPRTKVSGKVTYKEKPLPGGTVVFVSTEDNSKQDRVTIRRKADGQ